MVTHSSILPWRESPSTEEPVGYSPWGHKELGMTKRLPACWEPGFQASAQSPCPELSAQGLVPLRWGCALPSPNALGKAPNHIHTTLPSG